jgi:hypothetical protein
MMKLLQSRLPDDSCQLQWLGAALEFDLSCFYASAIVDPLASMC